MPTTRPPRALEHFPVSFFAVGMGTLGLTLALHAAERSFGLEQLMSHAALAMSVVFLTLIALGYIAKALRHPQAIKAEWNHPIRIAFFPAISISILLLAAVLAGPMPVLANILWLVGAAIQGGLALSVVGAWIGSRAFAPVHVSPAWFIPAVGNVIVPLAGVQLGHAELSWIFFSAGVMFWLVLLTLVINRLMFHDPLPGRLIPTLVILVAPPSVSFIAWVRLTGEVGPFGHILISLGYVFAAIVVTQAPKFFRLPFALSWWALSFPVAALSSASFLYAEKTGSQGHVTAGIVLLMVLVVIVGGLIGRTLLGMVRGEICQPE